MKKKGCILHSRQFSRFGKAVSVCVVNGILQLNLSHPFERSEGDIPLHILALKWYGEKLWIILAVYFRVACQIEARGHET